MKKNKLITDNNRNLSQIIKDALARYTRSNHVNDPDFCEFISVLDSARRRLVAGMYVSPKSRKLILEGIHFANSIAADLDPQLAKQRNVELRQLTA